jgi:hypothetical protein
MADAIRKRFLIGVLLAWVPWIPAIVGLVYAFRGISNTKATGIAVVAGGLGEGFALWGVVAMVIAQIAAIVWLAKSFSSESWLRNLVSIVSIVLSGLMLVLVCLFVASVWFSVHH